MNNLYSEFEMVIGLEIHAQIKSNSKLFSPASTEFDSPSNWNVDLFDCAMPGILPMINFNCIKQAIKAGIALNCKINQTSIFDRKHYFYPDLPNGYQISQYYHPIAEHGYVFIDSEDKSQKKISIERLHLEQDAGKSLHDVEDSFSCIDYNRAGIGLMEIVSAAEINSSYQASQYVKKIRLILQYIGACDGNMEDGSFRCDANISVRKFGAALGTRCEIKNLNSISNMIKALDYEYKRQVDLVSEGQNIIQETRAFNVNLLKTFTMRDKEDSNDYRYFQDFDILPIEIDDKLISKIKEELPELPENKIKKYVSMGIKPVDAEILVSDTDLNKFFEDAILVEGTVEKKNISNWIISELLSYLNSNNIKVSESKITPDLLVGLLKLIQSSNISGKIAKKVFSIMFQTGESASQIVKKYQLFQVTDRDFLNKIISEVLSNNSKQVSDYYSGKEKLFGFFVGEVMKKASGKADPTLVNQILKEKLTS